MIWPVVSITVDRQIWLLNAVAPFQAKKPRSTSIMLSVSRYGDLNAAGASAYVLKGRNSPSLHSEPSTARKAGRDRSFLKR